MRPACRTHGTPASAVCTDLSPATCRLCTDYSAATESGTRTRGQAMTNAITPATAVGDDTDWTAATRAFIATYGGANSEEGISRKRERLAATLRCVGIAGSDQHVLNS